MLTFRVCLARDLPQVPDMDPNYVYFAYDRLRIYFGNSGVYQGNYAIVPELPEEMSPDILYILETDGSINVWDDYQIKKIAEIEAAEQIELLKKSSTSFFHFASHRYLDKARRTINLPYENGSYELVVDIPNNIIVNDDTVLRYDVAAERFIEEGDEEIHTPYIGIHGSETDTVKLEVVSGEILKGDVKISSEPMNAIVKNPDGLYFDGSKYLEKDTYNRWLSEWQWTLDALTGSVESIEANLVIIRDLISEDAIRAMINDILTGYFPTIESAIQNYDRILNEVIPQWQSNVESYSDQKFNDTKTEIIEHFEGYFSNPWENENGPEYPPDEDIDPQLDEDSDEG